MIQEQQKQNLEKDKQTEQFVHLLLHSNPTKKETFQPLAHLLWASHDPAIIMYQICSLNEIQLRDVMRKLRFLFTIDKFYKGKQQQAMKELFQGFHKDIEKKIEQRKKVKKVNIKTQSNDTKVPRVYQQSQPVFKSSSILPLIFENPSTDQYSIAQEESVSSQKMMNNWETKKNN